jgi:hypothetical protein
VSSTLHMPICMCSTALKCVVLRMRGI